jgi:ataxia telangiectasia mutated family protein
VRASPFFLLNRGITRISFQALENIVATRMSLLASVRQKEQRQQIGDMVSPFTTGLRDVEKQCLLRISEAARMSNHLQIALNSVVRAHKLEAQPTSSLAQEYANVLWDQKEHKFAIQYLKDVVERYFGAADLDGAKLSEKALLLSRLVRFDPVSIDLPLTLS